MCQDLDSDTGVVGLQYNTDTGKVEFRDIKIRTSKHFPRSFVSTPDHCCLGQQ
jgi:hypothetical protein